jgi:hypothetical protein
VSSSNANAAGVVPFASYTISTQQRARRLLRDICQAIDELTKGDVELRRALEHHPTLLEYLAVRYMRRVSSSRTDSLMAPSFALFLALVRFLFRVLTHWLRFLGTLRCPSKSMN